MSFTALPPLTFKNLLESGEYFLLDIRTDGEVRAYGEIPGTKARYDMYEPNFSERILNLPRDEKYLMYCWHGNRTQMVREWMKQQGFSWVCDLEGGIDNWNI